MDKKIVLITITGLLAVNMSCTNKTSVQQGEQQVAEVDSIVLADSTTMSDDMLYVCL